MALVDLKSDLTWYGKPPAVNYFPDKASGAKGFTDNVDTTQFSGVNRDTYTYPAIVRGNRLMQPNKTVKFPGPQNFFDDKTSGASGFTLRMKDSKFLGIYGNTYTYPVTVLNSRLMKPVLSTEFPGPQNFFDDVNAKGFTSNVWKTGQSKKPTQFTGVSDGKYTYPSDLVRKFEGLNLQATSYNTNDTVEFRQPFIVRGMQRPGQVNGDAQRWGSAIDDGLIRGGAATTATRIAADVSRITKFLGTVKGRLWITKQIGLGLTNPKVETITGSTRIHTGVTSLLSVAGSPLGLHFTTHGIPFANQIDSYEKVQNVKSAVWSAPVIGNRLINLRRQVFGKAVTIPPLLGLPAVSVQIPGIPSGLPIPMLSGISGPQSVYGVGTTTIRRFTDSINGAFREAKVAQYPFKYGSFIEFEGFKSYAPNIRAKTKNENDTKHSNEIQPRDAVGVDTTVGKWAGIRTKHERDITLDTRTPGNDLGKDLSKSTNVYSPGQSMEGTDVRNYMTLAYERKGSPKKKDAHKGDFRNLLDNDTIGFTGKKEDPDYYAKRSLEGNYGFGELGKVGALDRKDKNIHSYGRDGKGANLDGNAYSGKKKDNLRLITLGDFRGDRVNALDIGDVSDKSKVYPDGAKDLIKFYFEDGEPNKNVMVFRATITGLTDSFTPGWDKIDIIGRPEGTYIYTSFERSISFNFRVAAMSRAEMIPIWRKLNYLSTYTMPDLTYAGNKSSTGKVSGPFMRITIGDMFQSTPGFINSLSYSVVDETSWDIADDADTNSTAKQLPTVIDVALTYTVISDYRPQLLGRAYGLSIDGKDNSNADNWLQGANT